MTEDRFIRMPELANTLGVSQRSIYYMIERNRFPRGVGLGDRTVVWSRRAVQEWMQRKIDAARN